MEVRKVNIGETKSINCSSVQW